MSLSKALLATSAMIALAGCFPGNQAGAPMPGFGTTTEMNQIVQIGYSESGAIYDRYAEDFAANVPDTVNFDFNSARLNDAGRATLNAQFEWLQANRLARLRLAGHTDLVGGEDFNLQLGLRRAEAVGEYLVARGISANRLDTVATFGESQPVVATSQRERLNRRVVTTVAGIGVQRGDGFDGERADAVFDVYIAGGVTVEAATGSAE